MLTILGLFIYDMTSDVVIFSCANFIIYLFLSFTAAVLSVYLTGFFKIENELMKYRIQAGGAIGVMAAGLMLIFGYYNKICPPPQNENQSPIITKSAYMVKIFLGENPQADTDDRLSVTLFDAVGMPAGISVDSLVHGKPVELQTRDSLQGPIEAITVRLEDIGGKGLDNTHIKRIEIKNITLDTTEFYNIEFRGEHGAVLGDPPINLNECKIPVIKNKTVTIECGCFDYNG